MDDPSFLQRKQDLKNALRQEYWKKITEPIHRPSGSLLFDEAMQRYNAVQPTRQQYFRPTVWTGMIYTVFLIFPMVGTMYTMKYLRETQEHKIRTGQIAYADRDAKFI